MRSRIGVALGVLALAVPSSAIAQWEVSSETDPMTDATVHYAISPVVESLNPMPAPYTGTEAWLAFACNEGFEAVRVGFSTTPNLVETSTGDGRDLIRTRIRWGEGPAEEVALYQTWGSSFLRFRQSIATIERVLSAGTVLLELNWFGTGLAHFRFPLSGASKGIAEARDLCAGQ